MLKCKNCNKELKGLKKTYCSRKCKESYRWKNTSEEEKVIKRKEARKAYSLNRDKLLKDKKEYYSKNREEIIKKNSLYKKNNPESDIKYSRSLKGRYRDYKKGAKKRGHAFELTLEDFKKLSEKKCYYCGDETDIVGVDRKDNRIGYTIENSVSCCAVCNRMKNIFGLEEFIDKCIKIANLNT